MPDDPGSTFDVFLPGSWAAGPPTTDGLYWVRLFALSMEDQLGNVVRTVGGELVLQLFGAHDDEQDITQVQKHAGPIKIHPPVNP